MNVKKKPLVSIILPTYNWKKERFIESVNSILNQSFSNFELIIINDASTNNIEETIEELKLKDERIVYIKNENNLKLTKSLNKWISLANGKYVARADDDDIWSDEKQLKTQIEFMENNLDYWIVWVNAEIIDENWNYQYIINRPWTDKELRENMLVWNRFIHSSIVIRKTILNKIWWYNPKWNMVEDYELWLRIWAISKMRNLTDINSKVRVNTKSITRKNYRKQKWMTLKLFFKYFKYYPKKYYLKALCFRFWELIIPPQIIRYILKKMKRIGI